jgi:hypothetical protein
MSAFLAEGGGDARTIKPEVATRSFPPLRLQRGVRRGWWSLSRRA